MIGLHSFGSELRWCALDGIRISETLMPPELNLAGHAHDAAQVCFVLEGTYRETTAAGPVQLSPGMVQVREPGAWHANRFSDEGALTLLLSFEPSRWKALQRRGPLHATSMLTVLATDMRRELQSMDDATSTILEGLSIVLLGRLLRNPPTAATREPEWLTAAASIVEREFATPLSLATLAARVGVHRATLSAAFRRFRRTSAGELIRDVRLRRATDALVSTEAPLAEIAANCGFADESHFVRVFHRRSGIPPGAFRRRYR